MHQCTKPRARFRQRGSNLILISFNTLIKKIKCVNRQLVNPQIKTIRAGKYK